MSISSATRKSGPYTGNNVTTTFSFAFKVFSQSEVVLVRTDLSAVETTLALSTDYTVTLNADQSASPGGSITLLAGPLATGFLLTITSNVQALQPVVLTNSGGFYPSIINDEFDRLTILLQQVAEQVERAVKTQISSGVDPNTLVASLLAAASSAAASATAAANSATAAANAVPIGSLTYTPVNKAGDTMTGNLAVPGINIGGSGLVTSLGGAASLSAGAAAGNLPTVAIANTLYAALDGLATQLFSVAPGTTANHAVNIGQFLTGATPNYFSIPVWTGTTTIRLIVQWYSGVNTAASGTQVVTFPVAFPTAHLMTFVTNLYATAAQYGGYGFISATTSAATVARNNVDNTNGVTPYLLSVGY